MKIEVDIVETVFVIVPQNKKYLVGSSRVFDRKCKRRFVTIVPGMTGYAGRFLVQVDGSTGTYQELYAAYTTNNIP